MSTGNSNTLIPLENIKTEKTETDADGNPTGIDLPLPPGEDR